MAKKKPAQPQPQAQPAVPGVPRDVAPLLGYYRSRSCHCLYWVQWLGGELQMARRCDRRAINAGGPDAKFGEPYTVTQEEVQRYQRWSFDRTTRPDDQSPI